MAGFLCAFSFVLSGIAIARHPGLLAPAAIVVALVAARMTVAHRTLAAVAVFAGALAFFVGMIDRDLHRLAALLTCPARRRSRA